MAAVIVPFNSRPAVVNPCVFKLPRGGRRRRGLAVARADSKREGAEVDNAGVRAAVWVLKLYKREISPALPKSCRYVPTCSEYGMEAYRKYGFVKGTLLTTWRICRCNPLGSSGFDPPRWFDE